MPVKLQKKLKKTFRVPKKGEVRKTARRAFEPIKKVVKKVDKKVIKPAGKKVVKPVGKVLKKTFRVPKKGEVRKTARRAFEPLKKLKHI